MSNKRISTTSITAALLVASLVPTSAQAQFLRMAGLHCQTTTGSGPDWACVGVSYQGPNGPVSRKIGTWRLNDTGGLEMQQVHNVDLQDFSYLPPGTSATVCVWVVALDRVNEREMAGYFADAFSLGTGVDFSGTLNLVFGKALPRGGYIGGVAVTVARKTDGSFGWNYTTGPNSRDRGWEHDSEGFSLSNQGQRGEYYLSLALMPEPVPAGTVHQSAAAATSGEGGRAGGGHGGVK